MSVETHMAWTRNNQLDEAIQLAEEALARDEAAAAEQPDLMEEAYERDQEALRHG